MTAARRYHSTDPRQAVMFDLVAVPLKRAPVANDVGTAERTYTRRAPSSYERRARRRDPYGFNLPGVEVERAYGRDERPQWVATIDAKGRLLRLVLRLTVPAARKLLSGEEPRFRKAAYRQPQLDLFILGRPYVPGQTYSVCQVLRGTGGDPTSGQQRVTQTQEVEDLVRRYFDEQLALYDEEHAVLRTFSMLSRNPTWPRPQWFNEYIQEYKQELLEDFTGGGHEPILPDWDI